MKPSLISRPGSPRLPTSSTQCLPFNEDACGLLACLDLGHTIASDNSARNLWMPAARACRMIPGNFAKKLGVHRRNSARRSRRYPSPIFRRHPITGRFVLYTNVGYTMFIDGMDEQESGEIVDGTCSVTRSAPSTSTRTTGRWVTFQCGTTSHNP